jgi:two-component system, NtrC family, C4-dicarboxylate transport response regulator DctD
VPFTYSELGGARPTRVLIVDDDDDVRRMTQVIFSLEGFEVVEAASVREAIAALDASPPDVLITDLFLRGADGRELIARLRGRAPEVPVILITGGSTTLDLSRRSTAELLGADEVLQKPFRSNVLVAAVRRVLKIDG